MKEKDTEKQLKALEEAVRQEQETGGKTAKSIGKAALRRRKNLTRWLRFSSGWYCWEQASSGC